MQFPTHVPPAPLRPFVAVAHGYRVPAHPTAVHRGLPSRHITLVVELTAPQRIAGPGEVVASHGVVGGLHTSSVTIDASRPKEGLQYGLTVLGAGALLGVPAAELAGHVVDLADLFGPAAERLLDRLHGAAGWSERFELLDAALLHRLDRGSPDWADVPPELSEAWRLVFASDGRVRVAAAAAHVGWSRRHLAERFRIQTGVTPKQAARIARFEAARRLLTSNRRPPLGDIAVRCGYADQPHLAREWAALAGCSIGTWLREELPFVQDGEADGPAAWPS